jgi:hypothetical protein
LLSFNSLTCSSDSAMRVGGSIASAPANLDAGCASMLSSV